MCEFFRVSCRAKCFAASAEQINGCLVKLKRISVVKPIVENFLSESVVDAYQVQGALKECEIFCCLLMPGLAILW